MIYLSGEIRNVCKEVAANGLNGFFFFRECFLLSFSHSIEKLVEHDMLMIFFSGMDVLKGCGV